MSSLALSTILGWQLILSNLYQLFWLPTLSSFKGIQHSQTWSMTLEETSIGKFLEKPPAQDNAVVGDWANIQAQEILLGLVLLSE